MLPISARPYLGGWREWFININLLFSFVNYAIMELKKKSCLTLVIGIIKTILI